VARLAAGVGAMGLTLRRPLCALFHASFDHACNLPTSRAVYSGQRSLCKYHYIKAKT
jgi:hypothetical protein